jgi:hypothetical protein
MFPPKQSPLRYGGETEEVSTYLKAKFSQLQHGTSDPLKLPLSWTLDFLVEVDLAANVLYVASRNEGSLADSKLQH